MTLVATGGVATTHAAVSVMEFGECGPRARQPLRLRLVPPVRTPLAQAMLREVHAPPRGGHRGLIA